MKSHWKKLFFILAAVGLVGGLIIAYTVGRQDVAAEAAGDKPLEAASRVELVNGENVVTLDAATRASSGVILGPLETVLHQATIPAYGNLINPGELTDLRNTLANAGAQLAKAEASLLVARREFERVKGLFAANQNVSEKTVQAADGALRTEEASLLSAQAAVEAARATAQQRWGSVIAVWLFQGTSEFTRLQRQEDLLVQVTLAPSQGATTAPATGSIQTPTGRLVSAKLVSPASRTDSKIQGRSYFYVVPATDPELLPGMNAVMLLPVGEPAPGVVVPASAVVWLQGKPWAYVQVKPDGFVRREISTEQPVVDGWVEAKDFSKGGPVVATGAQVLLSEEFRAQISISN